MTKPSLPDRDFLRSKESFALLGKSLASTVSPQAECARIATLMSGILGMTEILSQALIYLYKKRALVILNSITGFVQDFKHKIP